LANVGHLRIIHQLNKVLLHAAFDIALNVVFNTLMDDKTIIESLGGPTRVCELLGLDKHGGVQRVQNWITRGIPYRVKVEHADIFLNRKSVTSKAKAKEAA